MGKNNRPVNVCVEFKGKTRSFEQLIRSFNRLCKKEGIIKQFRDHSFYVSKGEKERKKKHAAKMRSRRARTAHKKKVTRK